MNIADLREQLIVDEGLRLKPYVDTVGKSSIGVGRNLSDKGISNAEAMMLLDNDIAEHTTLLDKYLPWWTRLDEPRQLALANLAFNLGVGPSDEQPTGHLLSFKPTLDLIARGEYDQAADHLAASRWAGQVGKRAERIIATIRTGNA